MLNLHVKRIIVFVILLFTNLIVNAQGNSLQAISLASGTYYTKERPSIWVDWRLDLGISTLELNQTKAYFFTAGMLQPNINRFSTINDWKQYDPGIQLRYPIPGHTIVLVSSAPDLIFFGFKIFDSNGRLLKTDATKIASSYLAKPIDLTGHSNGIYYLIVYYLPERIDLHQTISYYTSTLKIMKQ